MPHYPEEIEYSDKYVDSHYEYRHVMLPKEIYKKLPKGRLLSESVSTLAKLRNGATSESNSPEAGSTTRFTSQSLTSCCSVGRWALIP